MDRLLVVTPSEVRFSFETGKKACTKIRLYNALHTMPVAFRVLTNAPKKYTMHPQCLIIPPHGELVLEIVMAAQDRFPDGFPYSRDMFYVKSLMVPTGKATQSELRLWFSTRKKHVFNDASLRVVYTGRHILWRLAVSGSLESVSEVLRDTPVNMKDSQARTALHVAAVEGNSESVDALVRGQANVNAKTTSGQTPLFEAVYGGHSEIVKVLLAAGADTGLKAWDGCSPLHAAVAWKHNEIVKLLLDAGADKDATDDQGRTPLHEAASGGNFDALAALVRSGADVERRCLDGSTALHIAASCGCKKIVELLLKEGAGLNARNHEGKTPYDLARDNGLSQVLALWQLQQMLWKASRKNDLSALMNSLPDELLDSRDQHGWTALHRASFKGHLDMVKLLLKLQVDINVADGEGYTPLHCAVEAGQKEVVYVLLQHGANRDVKINSGLTPAALASKMEFLSIRQLIEEAKLKRCRRPRLSLQVFSANNTLSRSGQETGAYRSAMEGRET